MAMSPMPTSCASWWPRTTASDVLSAFAAPWIAILIRDETVLLRAESAGLEYASIAFVATIAMFAYFRVGSELPRYFSAHDAGQIAKASFAAVVLSAALAFSLTRLEAVPRSLPAIHFLVLLFLLVCSRALTRAVALNLDHQHRPGERCSEYIVLIGADEAALLFVRAIGAASHVGIHVAAVLDVELGRIGRTLSGHRIVGTCAAAPELLDEMRVHGVSVSRCVVTTRAAAPGTHHWQQLARDCSERGIALEYLSEQLGRILAGGDALAQEKPYVSEPIPSPQNWYWKAKRCLDFAGSAVGIVLLSPLFIVTALLAVVSCGWPVLFWQKRLGRHARPIHVHKFRTMRAPFDRCGRKLSDSERETPLGRHLRATRLDELPQLLDILRGDMSLIGPRPLLPIDQPVDPTLRLSVRPGLTGWAQVHGGRVITPEEKNALDIWYIQNASLWLDLRILCLTAKAIVFGDKADRPAEQHAFALQPEAHGKVRG